MYSSPNERGPNGDHNTTCRRSTFRQRINHGAHVPSFSSVSCWTAKHHLLSSRPRRNHGHVPALWTEPAGLCSATHHHYTTLLCTHTHLGYRCQLSTWSSSLSWPGSCSNASMLLTTVAFRPCLSAWPSFLSERKAMQEAGYCSGSTPSVAQ